MNETIMRLQEAIVTSLARAIPQAWERIVVNYEMEEQEGGAIIHNRLGFYIAKDAGGNLHKAELRVGSEVEDMFRDMSDEFQRTVGERWGTCDLVVDPPGKFRFDFAYDPPKRINGVLDDDSYGRFGRYLETYKAECAKT